MRNHKSIICVALAISVAPMTGHAQFNIDIESGSGVPSADFGAAANQPGYWNAGDYGWANQRLRDLRGRPGPEIYASNTTSGLHRNVQANTGNYAALLNDGFQSGLPKVITLYKLHAGTYDIYTYGLATWYPYERWTEVVINQALSEPSRIMQSPTAGNQFEEGRTHTIHRVRIRNHEPLEIEIRNALPIGTVAVSGLQIVPVKE